MTDIQQYFTEDTYQKLQLISTSQYLHTFQPNQFAMKKMSELMVLPYDLLLLYKEQMKRSMDNSMHKEDFYLLSHHYDDVFSHLYVYDQAWDIRKIIHFDKNDVRIFITVLLHSNEVFRLRYNRTRQAIIPDYFSGNSPIVQRKLKRLHERALQHPFIRLRILF